jgi:hypothetical protein
VGAAASDVAAGVVAVAEIVSRLGIPTKYQVAPAAITTMTVSVTSVLIMGIPPFL